MTLNQFLTTNMARPEYMQRWPDGQIRRAELVAIYRRQQQAEAAQADPEEGGGDNSCSPHV